MKLNNERYILCYYILNYDDNRTFDLCVSYMSFINIFLTNIKSVIYCNFCHKYFEAVKYLHIDLFPMYIYINIGKFTITVTSKQRTPNSRAITGASWLWWSRSQYSFKTSTSGKLRQSATVSSQCKQFSQPWTWRTLYFDWWPHFKKWPIIVYLIKCNQTHFEKRPVIANCIKCW